MSADSRSDLDLVRHTLKDMVNAGELRRVGFQRVDGSCRPATLFAAMSEDPAAAAQLQSILTAWR